MFGAFGQGSQQHPGALGTFGTANFFGPSAMGQPSAAASLPLLAQPAPPPPTPYPKQTKFLDLPADVQNSLLALERSIHAVEDSAQSLVVPLPLFEERLPRIDATANRNEGKLAALEAQQQRLRMIVDGTRRRLQAIWRFGESVSRARDAVPAADKKDGRILALPYYPLDESVVAGIVEDLEAQVDAGIAAARALKDQVDGARQQRHGVFCVLEAVRNVLRFQDEGLRSLLARHEALHERVERKKTEYRSQLVRVRGDARDPFVSRTEEAVTASAPVPPQAQPQPQAQFQFQGQSTAPASAAPFAFPAAQPAPFSLFNPLAAGKQ